MSYDWESHYQRRQEERREYRADVFYEAWRRGMDPDRAADCADDCYYDGRSASECVAQTQAEIMSARQRRQDEEDYYAQQREDARQIEEEDAPANPEAREGGA